MHRPAIFLAGLAAMALLAGAMPARSSQLQLLLPLGRTLYQTNEIIDVSAVRSDTQALAAGQLVMTVTGADGSKLSFTFPAEAVAASGGAARATENLHLNGWLLRPGKYAVEVDCDGATANTSITVYSNTRKSTYKTIHWGGPAGDAMGPEGENGLGFNIIMTGDVLHQEPSIAAGEDVMGNALMGGGHQHDLRATNDWSDPYVYIGADQRGLDRAFMFRTMPNAIGAHLHDEPGLTWLPNPHYLDKSGQPIANDQDIPEQRAAMQRAFGHEPLWSDQVDVNNPAQYAEWSRQNDFKLGFMDAFWKSANEDLSRLKPGYIAVTQSQYGWTALFDGYYFNVARSLPVISGHGGYSSYWMMNMNPTFYLEFSLPRQLDKPTWYLPRWDDDSSDEVRLEHNMTFITGIQGISSPPGLSISARGAAGTTETNKLYQKIGTIFTVPEFTNQDVAVLYSKSNLYYQKQEISQGNLGTVYLATKILQYPFQAVLEEDILDGSLAANHKAVVITGVKHLDAPVIAGLADFARGGGLVLVTSDVPFAIPGAVKLDIDPEGKFNNLYNAAQALADPKAKADATAKISTFNYRMKLAKPLAALMGPALVKAGIKPTFQSSVPTIAAGKQVLGDIEYDFAVNFTVDPNDLPANGGLGVPVATSAKITLPDDGRPVYDAVTGKPVAFDHGVATLPFGPGQMYAFARPVRPIGGVQVGAPVINRDYTRTTDPQYVEITASLVDSQQKLIAGNAPMEVKVVDPLGATRYDIYRCAEHGVLNANLPIAANDPDGKWTVTVAELLSGAQGSSAFNYKSAPQCGALAGSTFRSVVFGDDIPNIYKFFRDHRNVTVVAGSSPWDAAAAQRLVNIFKPYNVNVTIESMSDANQARPITDEEALTWCGDQAAGLLDAATRKNAQVVGYNLPAPTILVGNAADNPLIGFMTTRGVLPYKVTADFPGVGHGMVAWNLMCLGHDVESIALIGNDEAGVNEAVGTAFQIGIGVDPLTPYVLPVANSVSAATMIPAAATQAAAK